MTSWQLTVAPLCDVSDAFQNCAFWNPGTRSDTIYLKRVVRTVRTTWATFEVATYLRAIYDPTMKEGVLRIGSLQRRVTGLTDIGTTYTLVEADPPPVAAFITVTSSCPDMDRIAATLDGHCVGRKYRFAIQDDDDVYHKLIVKSVSNPGVHLFRAGVTEIRWAERAASDLL